MKGGSKPTFHVMIASSGRPSLKEMVASLQNQLLDADALTIIFDGREARGKSGYNETWTSSMKCKVNIKEEEKPHGNWGHPVLNKHIPLLSPETTYVMFADDDDTYIEGSFDKLRSKCTDPNTLYISKMKYADHSGVIPFNGMKAITKGVIGKPNGIIPFKDAGKSSLGSNRFGDYDYYAGLKDKVANIVFLDDVIYRVGPGHS